MTAAPASSELPVRRCLHCHNRFLPRPGPCPSCGSGDLGSATIPPRATVLASTELVYPASGWPTPHRLALVEAAEGVRLLARVEGELPVRGSEVAVRPDGPGYVVRGASDPARTAERGEGESPGAGPSRRPFEPPR